MPVEFIPEAGVPSANTLQKADDHVLPRPALMAMRDLEASLEASRKALLALDLVGIEAETREQVRLIRQLESALPPIVASPSVASRIFRRQPAEGGKLVRSADAPQLDEELRLCCGRILEAARLQAALLARARAKLRVLANMLAGQSVTYGPPGARTSAPQRASGWNSRGEI